MNTILLERRALPEADPQAVITQDVLDYAHHRLGYHHPEKEKLCREGSLAQALRVAGITPFSHTSVWKYKEQQVSKFQTGNGRRAMLCLRFLVISLALAVAGAIVFNANDLGLIKTIGSVSGTTFAVVFSVFCVICINAIPDKKASWRVVALNEYVSPVPGFALATAKEIHQRVTGATFFIDEMVVEQVQKDPFLVVRGDGEEYYVEVWDEPGYEQKRKA